ncbi:hypothetical protein [Vibrio pectenicida]|uniref:hypothetical protein n=1 Tax=Vibrio pectenicida TaxID=62763 RepID=UPI001FE8BDB4|nr:hypothetical protein [Vibrio pectenicida]
MAQDDNIVPIPGTKKLHHLIDNFGAASINLPAEELVYLESILKEFEPVGERYTAEGMKGVNA